MVTYVVESPLYCSQILKIKESPSLSEIGNRKSCLTELQKCGAISKLNTGLLFLRASDSSVNTSK